MAPCALCSLQRAILKRPKTGQAVCRGCFFKVFETEIHNTIVDTALFKRGEKVGIAASGGKDSTVLAHIMTLLNDRYDYGLDLQLLSIDEGIAGYRDASLDTVKRNSEQYKLPLKVLSYDELYNGWTMDKVVAKTGRKGNCTYCGVFRRRALDYGGSLIQVDHIVTGHNADDVAETVLMNILRGDIARVERCTAITTGGNNSDTVKRSKPFKYAYEKEIVMYAYFKKLDYHSTECIYSPTAYRGHARALVKDLEAIRPSAIIDIVYSGEAIATQVKLDVKRPTQRTCTGCGCLSSQLLCQACALLATLEETRLNDDSSDLANEELLMSRSNTGEQMAIGCYHLEGKEMLAKNEFALAYSPCATYCWNKGFGLAAINTRLCGCLNLMSLEHTAQPATSCSLLCPLALQDKCGNSSNVYTLLYSSYVTITQAASQPREGRSSTRLDVIPILCVAISVLFLLSTVIAILILRKHTSIFARIPFIFQSRKEPKYPTALSFSRNSLQSTATKTRAEPLRPVSLLTPLRVQSCDTRLDFMKPTQTCNNSDSEQLIMSKSNADVKRIPV